MNTSIPKNIKRLRQQASLTQDQLAEKLFVTRQTVSLWENGKTQPDIETLEHSLIKVSANIKSGLLYYDDSGVPMYGVEVGQKTSIDGEEVFRKFARFTADRLSFYDQNDNEVAYISDYKLYITHVEIKGSLKEGGYKDFVTDDGGIVTKWVGTGG